jgi:hypothetical protein
MTTLRKLLTLAVCAWCMWTTACAGVSRSKSNTIANSGQNVVPISVTSGPTGNYANGVFASVTVCVPGSATCQTITDVLVDTGSSGLRLLSSALTVSLPQQSGASGHPVVECLPFLSGFTWGPIQTADIQMGGEKAASVPIQVLSDTAFPIAAGCKNLGLPSDDTLQALGANGILGVGLFAQDCGPACAQPGSSNPGLYYECPPSGCQITAEAVNQQVQNPVAMFAADNNGVIVELPAVNGAQASTGGSLVFGIGTQSNNSLGGATVYKVDAFGNFTTTYKGQSYPNSFVDSGSNGYFFLSSSTTGIPACSSATGFYCPSSTQNLSATNQGSNSASGTVNFSVANAESLFANQNDFVFGNLGGPGHGGFDWGLPFFFGRNVFTAIEGKSTPGGTGPYWAY